MTADANLDVYSAPPGWREKAQQQTAFVARQDALTLRARFLYAAEDRANYERLVSGERKIVLNENLLY